MPKGGRMWWSSGYWQVDEDALRRFRPQVDLSGGAFHRAHEVLNMRFELLRLGELAAVILVTRPADLVGAKALMAFLDSTRGSVKFWT